jgi:hypothetical protein
MTLQAQSTRQHYRGHWSYGAAFAFKVGIVLALVGAVGPLATEALADPSKFRDDPIPYCLSYIAHNESCERDSKDSPRVCKEAHRNMTQPSCIKWDEASILKFCRGWTDNSSVFGVMPQRGYCLGGRCFVDTGFPATFACLNPK